MTVEELARSQSERWARASRQLRDLLDRLDGVDEIKRAALYATIREARDEVGKLLPVEFERPTDEEIQDFWEIAREW